MLPLRARRQCTTSQYLSPASLNLVLSSESEANSPAYSHFWLALLVGIPPIRAKALLAVMTMAMTINQTQVHPFFCLGGGTCIVGFCGII